MRERAARLLFPALRWKPETEFQHERARIEHALEAGVGGFIIFGGNAHAVRELTDELHERSRHPILIGADMERGAGQQFAGATPLPPLAAIGYLDDIAITRSAGELTGREARALGLNWIYAPDADVDLEPDNPIVGTRSFGTDPAKVARHVGAWIDGCHAAGTLATAKHFPGHGRTTTDSHAELPRVEAARNDLDVDLTPFRAAITHRVDALMTAHVSYPALDISGVPATLSHTILTDLLRNELRFTGLVLTDALNMAGVLADGSTEGEAGVRAVLAGCDALLYPSDVNEVVGALEAAVAGARVPLKRIDESIARIEAAAARASELTGLWGLDRDRDWAIDIAQQAVHVVRGRPVAPDDCRVLTVDDDLGGPFPPPPREDFVRTLVAAGYQAADVDADPTIIAVYCDIRAWKGRPGLSAVAKEQVRRHARDDTTIVLFGHPRLAADMAGDHVVSAWGGEPLMQQAAALWLHKGRA